jgi:flagellar hook assembly protein FlgD
VADGSWRLVLRFFDAAGNPAARSFTVRADSTDPQPGVTASPPAFSPNGDGAADTTRLRWTSSEAVTGTLRLSRGSTTIRRWSVSGTAGAVTWTGRDTAGRTVADGAVTITLTVTDPSGNRAAATKRLVVDRTASFLRARPSAFYPQDGDALARTTSVSFRLSRSATTRLRVLDPAGAVVRTAWSSRAFAAGTHAWTWNGKSSAGAMVPRGRYVLELTATGSLGTTVLHRSIVVDAFVATPSATTVAAGQTLTVRFRPVEPLARAPRATFTQAGRAAAVMTVTRLADGTYRATVRVAAGAPGAARVTISGVDSAGGKNTTVLLVTVR